VIAVEAAGGVRGVVSIVIGAAGGGGVVGQTAEEALGVGRGVSTVVGAAGGVSGVAPTADDAGGCVSVVGGWLLGVVVQVRWGVCPPRREAVVLGRRSVRWVQPGWWPVGVQAGITWIPLAVRRTTPISASFRVPFGSRWTCRITRRAAAAWLCRAGRDRPPRAARASRRAGTSAGELACRVPAPPSWPVLRAASSSQTSAPRTSPTTNRSGRMRRAWRTSSRTVTSQPLCTTGLSQAGLCLTVCRPPR
jgi:hypothetical protein